MDTRKRRKEGRCSQSLMFESLQSLPKRAKVHAQRKFAQGSQPTSPALTPMKELRELRERTVQTECRTRLGCSVQGASNAVHPTPAAPTLMNAPTRPKTEDFLTFLCFRRTSLLPPELEFFETPQLMESGGGSDSQGITTPHDEKSSKSSLQKKKEDLSFPCEKKGVPLSKESIKRSLQDIESETTAGFIRSARVTRSSASLTPTPSFLSSPPSSNHVAQEGVPERRLSRKQILLKKAMLFKTKSLKAHRRRVQVHLRSKVENRRGVLPRSDSVKAFSPALNISTRNRARKSAKLFSLRKKEQISRVLKRLGSSVILSSIEKGRVTRSQIEASDDPVATPPADQPLITPAPKREVMEEVCIKEGRRRKSINEESHTSGALPSMDLCLIKEKAIMEESRCPAPKDLLPRRGEVEERSCRKTPSPRHDPTLLTSLPHTQVLRKRKINPRKMRVTRQLLSMREKGNAENELTPPQETIARPRCTRSASDPVSSSTRSQILPKVARITSERSKSCDDELSLGELVAKMKNKFTESHLPEKTETIVENDICSSLRNRPSRKTKQVAEVYLELMSQRLAKESQKGKDLSDDDIEEDNISISSIKELKSLTKSCKNKVVDLEKCIHEIAERHEKEVKEEPGLTKESKLQAKTALGKRSAGRAKVPVSLPDPLSPKKKVDSSCSEVTKRHLRFTSVALAEGSNATGEGEKDKVCPPSALPLRRNRSRSPKTSECDPSIEVPNSLSPRAIRVLHRHTSPQLPKLTRQSAPKDVTSVQHSTVKELSPSSIKPEKQSSPKPSIEETTMTTSIQKVLRKRPFPEAVKVAKKEIQQTLDDDSNSRKEKESEKMTSEMPSLAAIETEDLSDSEVMLSNKNENIKEMELEDTTKPCSTPILKIKSSDNAVSPKGLLRTTTVSDSLLDSKDEPIKRVEPKNPEMNGNLKEEEIPVAQPDISERLTPPKLNGPVEEPPNVGNNVESSQDSEGCNPTLKSKKMSKPKCLMFSSRCKRTLSLDSDQNTSPKSIRLKRKFGSMESVISANMKLDSTEPSHSSTSGVSSSQSKPSNAKEVKQKPAEGGLGAVSQWKKSIFSRRRNSIHDEAKLNAVLESVAKDFEKDMDDQLYDKIEKDLNSGNKSPDKTNRTLLDSLEQVKDKKISPEVQEQQNDEPCQEDDPKLEKSQLEEPQLQPDVLAKPEVEGEEPKQKSPPPEMPLPEKEIDKEIAASEDLSATASPLMQSSPSSGSPVPRKSSTGKKLCDVVRNLQERKQAESPLTYIDTEAPLFLQDLKALDSRNSENPKQVSEEAIVVPPFELAPAPSISSHLSDVKDRASLITLKQSTHSCTSGQRAPGDFVPDKITECSIDKKDLTIASSLEKEVAVPLLLPSPVVTPLPTTKPTPILEPNSASINNSNVAVTTFIPFPSVNADPMLSMPIPSVNIAINTRPLTPLRPQTNIHVAPGQLPTNLLPPRIAHLGHGVTIAPAPLPVNPASTLAEGLKIPKLDQVPPKPSSKQVLIAPKPSWTQSSVSGNSGQGIGASVKNAPKPIQIAPKFPANTCQAASVGHLHSSAPILSASQVGHVIQGMPHAVQAMQSLPQGLQTVQGIPTGVQPLQAITQNFTTIAGMTSAVQAVITQTMAINQSQLVTPSSPKIITQPVFVTSSMPNMVATPFDITMQNHLHSNVGAVARVVTQNVVGKVAPKPQASLVSSGTQSLVTLPPGSIETNVIPSLVPFHQTLQHGQPAQFVAVNMMPVAPSPISLPGARPITSQMGPIICPQTMACMASSNAVAGSVPSVSTPLNLIPPGSIVTCPIPDVNASICNANLLQSLQPISANNEGTQSIKGNISIPVPVLPVNSVLPTVTSESTTTTSSSDEEETPSLVIDSTKVNRIVIDTSIGSETAHKLESKETLGPDKPCEVSESFQSIVDASKSSSEDKENDVRINMGDDGLNFTPTPSEEQNLPGPCSNLLSTLKKNKSLKIEMCSLERRNSAFYSFSAVVTPPVVSQTVSKIFPVTTVTESLISKPLSGSLIKVTSSDLAEASKTFSQTGANLPLNTITSHMILSNFVYTTTSVVIPKMPDQSMTSPKAVTKVSQSSPPYVLSTSTSNDAPAQQLTNCALLPQPHLKENSIESQNSINSCSNAASIPEPIFQNNVKSNSKTTGMVQGTIMVNGDPEVCEIAKTTSNLSQPKPALVTTPMKHKGNVSKLETNSIVLSPKTFYNNVPNKGTIDDPVLKVPKAPTFEVKLSCNPLSSSSRMTLPTTSASNSQGISESSQDSNIFRSEKQNVPIKNKFQAKDKKPIISVNNLNVSGKEILKGRDFEKKREPILKKTLFKTKNVDEKKASEAFSPLNESSVYAFEPDKDTLLEVTSPFSQRIKNIHPSPIISPIKPPTPLNLKNSSVIGKESLKDVKMLNKTPKRTILTNKNDAKVFSAKLGKEDDSSPVTTPSPLSPYHQSMSKSVMKLSIGDQLKLPSLPNNNPIVNKVGCLASSKTKKIIPPTLPSTLATTPQLSSEVTHVSRSSHQALNVKPSPSERLTRQDSVVWQSPPSKELPMKDPGKTITSTFSSNPQESGKTVDREARTVFKEVDVSTKEDNMSENKQIAKERALKTNDGEEISLEKQIKAKEKARYVGKEVKLTEIEVIPVDDAVISLEKEVKQIGKDSRVIEGPSKLSVPHKETKPMEIEAKSLDRLQEPFENDPIRVERDDRLVNRDVRPHSKDVRPHSKDVRPHLRNVRSHSRDVRPIGRDAWHFEKDARPLERETSYVDRPVVREAKLIKEVSTVEKDSRLAYREARPVERQSRLVEREASTVERETMPAERETRLVKNVSKSVEREAMPVERVSKPVEREFRPVERESMPVERESRLVEREARPVEKEARPVEREARVVEKEARPVEREARLIERETRLVKNVCKSVEREAMPVEREFRPVERESMPVEREARPVEREAKAVEREAARALEKEARPVEREASLVERGSRPVEREVKPLEKDAIPTEREGRAVKTEARPIERETFLPKEGKPIEIETMSIDKEGKSIDKDVISLGKEHARVQEDLVILDQEVSSVRNIAEVNLKDLESESNDSEELEIEAVNIGVPAVKSSSSTSIAIQCDLDDSQDELRGNESGTQTEGPSKFPLPPSASPFYYLPLAMATLGEKLPAQLVQQMLAKTQGLVGAAEAGLILQQAAQLAQQYHRTTEEEGPPSLPPSPAVKPISPKSGSIALQKALRANLASIAQAEISVAQSSGISLCPSSPPPPSPKDLRIPPLVTSPKGLLKVAASLPDTFTTASSPKSKEKPLEKAPKSTPTLFLSLDKESGELPEPTNSTLLTSTESTPVKTAPSKTTPSFQPQFKSKPSKVAEVTVKRRSGRSSTLAATKATESDLHEVEEQRRNRKAKRVAAALAKEEGWSSSSEAPMSPVMSPDVLRGWPPPRLTSPTPSQSSDGTTASSSTLSQWSRVSAPHSRRQSPASGAESIRRGGRFSVNASSSIFSADPVIDPGPLHISEQPRLARAPSFFPSEEEFTDPLDYIEKIRPEAEQFGLCRIVPPSTFRPECRVNDDMRFTAYKQYIHRMMHRWGPNDHALRAIKKCLAKQNIELASNPVIGGLELDLVQLYKVVEKHGGLMKVIEKELWTKVADVLRIPKSAQDRVAKLDRIYCKYLLPYAMLSKGEREQLLTEVEAAHKRFQSDEGSKKSAASNESSDDDDDEPLECIVKGKSTALSGFYRIARNVAGQWQPDPVGLEFDERYWDTVKEGESYICVHTASIDTSEHSYGFPSQKNSPNAKHPWNLKNLCQNPNSVLRSMGNVIGVTAPTLHVGMMFSSVCWYRDPHSLPWIEYLHTGACKIWYGVSANNEENFRSALSKLVPDFIKDSPLWLPSDTAMVPPEDLTAEGVKVCRVVQEPGQFVVVFPGAFTSSVCSGYLISESAFFARPLYFDRAVPSFKTLFECCEPSMFSLDRLALSVASDTRATLDALIRARQVVATVVEREKCDRHSLVQLGLTASERLSTPDAYRKRKNRYVDDEEENCCEICRQHLYVSLVTNLQEETVYCLQHAISFLTKSSSHLSSCKLMYTYSLPELTSVLKQMDDRIHTKANKKIPTTSVKRGKFSEQDSLSSTSGSNF